MRITVLFLLCLPVLASAAENATIGPFSFVEQPIRIAPGSQDGATEITLRSAVPQQSPPSVTDVELPHPPAATVSFERINEQNPQSTTWRYKVRVLGLLLPNTIQQRYAVVTFGNDSKQTIPYVISNAASSFAWNISKLPDPWVASSWLTESSCTEFTVTPKDSPATNVTLGSTVLIEQNTKKALGIDRLQVCDAQGSCQTGQSINLPANLPSRLRICTAGSFHGNFHGVVTLTSAQKPDGDSLFQNALFSSAPAKCAGLAALCVGIYLAWWSKVWARARLERDQSLMPAILMRSQVAALQQLLKNLPPTYRSDPHTIMQALEDLLDNLSDSRLDSHQFLPPSFPSPFGYTVDAAGYKAFLESKNPVIQALSVLVKEGVIPAQSKDTGNLASAQRAFIESAIKSIDAIAATEPLPGPNQAFQLVQPILANLQAALFPVAPVAGISFVGPTNPPPSGTETLQLQIQSISKGIWLLYGVLTALSGFAVLVLNNPGFGVPLDFIFAFFWGFGLPTTLGTLAPGSAASALNISVAKS